MSFNRRKLIRIIHLWLGLTSGLVVFIIAVTGAIWTFEQEISDRIYAYRKVTPQPQSPVITIAEIKRRVQPYLSSVNSITYAGNDRSIEVRDWDEIDGERINNFVYLNPYTGKVLAVRKNKPNFFDVVLELHTNLMLGETGAVIVKYATLVFLLIIISGIYLWWPKKSRGLKQRLSFNWKKGMRWRRKNYDLHTILGFYASWIILFAVITGLAWTFRWVDRALYATATFGTAYKEYTEIASESTPATTRIEHIEDAALSCAKKQFGRPIASWHYYEPQNTDESITLYLNPKATTWYTATTYFFDQRTGKLLLRERPEDLNNGQLLRTMYYDIHIGKILGFPGQLLVFFASLIVASLPVTGFLVWRGRHKKDASKAKKGAFSAPKNASPA